MSDDNDAELAALKPLVAQAALEGGIQINRHALKLFAKAVRAKGGNATMPVAELFKFVKETAAEEPTHVLLAPAKPTENRRQRAIADLERTEALANATRRPTAQRKKLTAEQEAWRQKFGTQSLFDRWPSLNFKGAPPFIPEGEGDE